MQAADGKMGVFPLPGAAVAPTLPMPRSLIVRWPLAALATSLAACALFVLAPARAQSSAAEPAQPLALTTTARLLAGVQPQDSDPRVAAITATEAWRAHARAARAGDHALSARLAHMRAWQGEVLAPLAGTRPLVYPFSGPDFINAYALFPQAPRMVFFSLEPLGDVPDLTRLSETEQAALYADLRTALNDLVALNFFITPNMKENLQTQALQGSVPLLMAMMGVLGLEVDGVERFTPWPAAPGARATPQGVRLRYHAGTPAPAQSMAQSLEYLALDVSDAGLSKQAGFLPWLHSVEQPVVLLKAASYLLHGSHFRKLRRQLLADTWVLVQDDSGIPYAQLRDAGWRIALYGQYEQPVKLFEERAQPDLEQAYAAAGPARALPFPFGYNWRKEGHSGVIVAQRPGGRTEGR
jgi:hypothetical protein